MDDCQNLNPGDAGDASDIPAEVPDEPESAGEEQGRLDGCRALFKAEGILRLNHGTASYTDSDCPIGSIAPAPPPPQHKPRRPAVQKGAATVRREGYEPRTTGTYDTSNQLRVLVGVRTGSATGHAQRAFFFLEDDYLGTDASDESAAINVVDTSDDTVTLQYVLFEPDDPYCCLRPARRR